MKKTLNESTVRRFMKLARIDGLTENFVTTSVDEDVDNTYEENLGVEEDDLLDLETDDEVLDLEGEAALDLDPDTVETIVDAVVTAIGDVTGTDTTVSSSAGAVDDLEDEAEDVFDGEQAVDLEDTIDDEDEGLDALEETDGERLGAPSKTRKGRFDYDPGPTAEILMYLKRISRTPPRTRGWQPTGEREPKNVVLRELKRKLVDRDGERKRVMTPSLTRKTPS